jgi:actin-related protein
MQLLWKHLFENELKVDPSTLSVLLTEAPYNPKVNREHMVEYMFEGFSVQKAYIAIQAVLSIYATGRTTGLITDIGDGVTHTVPIYEGFSIQHAVNRFNLAGRDITDYLSKLLYEIGIETSSSSMKEIVKDIKEKMSYISSDFESDIESAKSTPGEFTKQYQLPDGQIISMTDQLFRCAELLFRPSLNGFDMPGLHRILNKSIQEADIDLRKSMYENIILSGGTTTIPGIAERLEKEMYFIAPSAIQTKIVALPQRKYLVYSGGVALASLECFQDQWITKNDYLEYGSNIVHIKCI